MIAAIGELVLDVTIAPESALIPDDDQDARIQIGGGGQAANFCAWAASLGERARLITRVGGDEIGRRLVNELQVAGVEVAGPLASEPTGAIAVVVGPDGQRTFARQRGASRGLRAEEVDESWVDGVRLLHLSGYALYSEPLASAARKLAGWARERGAVLSVDLASEADLKTFGAERMVEELRRLRPELLFATEAESAALPVPPVRLAKLPVIKLGPRGCRVFNRRIPAPTIGQGVGGSSPQGQGVVDGTGAGDALAAAFCVSYLEGATPLEAAGRAVLVAARAVSKVGARP